MFLVDTNVLSELVRPRPAPKVVHWAAGLERMTLSAVTLEEVWYGLNLRPSARVERWLEAFLGSHCDVLSVTPAVARRAGSLRGQLARQGHTRTQADMLIAATAQEHGLTLATRNVRDFVACGIQVVNPFT